MVVKQVSFSLRYSDYTPALVAVTAKPTPRDSAAAASVAPVVMTSSTRTDPTGAARCTRNFGGRRLRREVPACAGAHTGAARQDTTGSPVNPPSSLANSRPGSMPNRASRVQTRGIGTRAREASGTHGTITAARVLAAPFIPWYFNWWTSLLATPSWANAGITSSCWPTLRGAARRNSDRQAAQSRRPLWEHAMHNTAQPYGFRRTRRFRCHFSAALGHHCLKGRKGQRLGFAQLSSCEATVKVPAGHPLPPKPK